MNINSGQNEKNVPDISRINFNVIIVESFSANHE